VTPEPRKPGAAFWAAVLLVWTINGRSQDPEYCINWPVATRNIIYAAIVGMLLVLASIFFPQVQS